MSNAQLLLTLILLQQGLLGLVWMGTAALGLSRRPAMHWGAANLAAAAALMLVVQRESGLAPWAGVLLANTLGLLAYVLNRRGVQLFCSLPPTDREHLFVLAAGALLLAAIVASGAPQGPVVLVTSLLLAYSLLRAGAEALNGLRAELGRASALACALPLWLLGGALALRAILVLVFPAAVGQPVHQGGSFNAALGLGILVVALLQNLGLGAMLVMRTVSQLRRLSDHDALTGLLNRRGLAAEHERQQARSRRGGEGYALLVVDLDHFKRVNDRHGHEAGDAVLCAVAQALRLGLRPHDAVARTGGEEFCVLLPAASQRDAQQAAERLRALVAATPVAWAGCTLHLSCSIGLSWSADGRQTLAELLRRADQAMYLAKAGGRNRVVVEGEVALQPA